MANTSLEDVPRMQPRLLRGLTSDTTNDWVTMGFPDLPQMLDRLELRVVMGLVMMAVQLSFCTSLLLLTHAQPLTKTRTKFHHANFLSGFFTRSFDIFRILVVQVQFSIPYASFLIVLFSSFSDSEALGTLISPEIEILISSLTCRNCPEQTQSCR